MKTFTDQETNRQMMPHGDYISAAKYLTKMFDISRDI
jgi:hypothetical protein